MFNLKKETIKKKTYLSITILFTILTFHLYIEIVKN